MSRIFRRDGRAVIVALDHGSFMREPMDGLMRVADTVRQVVAGGADAVLAPAGTAAAAVDALADTGLILSVNAAHPAVEKQVDTAVALGADGVKCMLYPFADGAASDLTGAVGLLAAHARQVGMPLMVEPIPGGWTAGADMRSADVVAAGARVAAELGATMVKTFYPGTPAGMRRVVDNALVPVVVLGGDKAGARELLTTVKDAVEGGASGVAIGRNIWQHEEPQRMVAAVCAVVHGGTTVDEALRELG